MRKFTFLNFLIVFLLVVAYQSNGQTVEFFDDFESGADNWVLTGDWGLTDEYYYSATNSMTDSPDGNYANNQDTYCTMVNGVDLSDPGILSAEVTFWAIYDIETSIDFDWVKVQASDDDFSSWADIGIFNGEDNLDPWIEYSYSLGAFIGSDDVKVRFHFHSDGGYVVDGIYFDDFTIISSDVDDAPPYIGYSNPPTFYEGSADDYNIEVELIDVSGISSATVYYTIDSGEEMSVEGVNTEDDFWEFTIPAQDPGSMVVFYIEAIDDSEANNTATTQDYKYIAGMYWYYDDPEVAFYSNVLADEGAAVVFTFPYEVQIVTGLIRNYEDQSTPPNKDFMFHVWTAEASGPGDDMITPFSVTPAATPSDPNPMTVVDLRDYEEELSGISGDVFIGMTVPEDTVKITMATLFANRSFVLSGGSWGAAAYDFHFRMVTTSPSTDVAQIDHADFYALVFPNPATDILFIESSVGNINHVEVVNMNGQLVYTGKANTEKTQIKISNLKPGVYFVNVETAKGVTTKKIIVK